jgi:hypothetical protein
VKRDVVTKIWAGLTVLAVELLLLCWVIASRGVDWLTAVLTPGR